MKLIGKAPHRDQPGSIKLEAEEAEDMWHVYHLIREGDFVTASTFRKVAIEGSSGEKVASDKVRITLRLSVESVDFDPEGMQIRVKGRNHTECDAVKLGAYHTIELEPQRAFSLEKASWDALDLDRIGSACDLESKVDVAVMLVQEGLANLVLVGGNVTLNKAKIETNIPRKRGAEAAGYDKAVEKFYSQCVQALARHVDFGKIRVLVLAGPGFARDALRSQLDLDAQRQDLRGLLENRDKIVLAHASTAFKGSLKEVLSNPAVASQVAETRAAREVRALEGFYAMMARDPARAFYGPGHVFAAAEVGGIESLLLTDGLFRTNSIPKRRKYAELVQGVRHAGGEVHIFSSGHASGEQLAQLSGIAAVLRFPMPELEEMEIPPPPELMDPPAA